MMAIRVDNNGNGYFKGDAVKLTGCKDTATYSVGLYEFEILEGRNQGEKIWQCKEDIIEV